LNATIKNSSRIGLNLIVSNTKDTKEHKKDAEINRKRSGLRLQFAAQGL